MENSYSGIGGIAYGSIARYGTLNLTASSPPQSFTEPMTLTEVKEYLNLPPRSPVDSNEDALISAMISAAREVAEIKQGRDLVRKQWDLSLDYFTTYQIELRAPLVSVDLVQYTDVHGLTKTLAQNTDFLVDAAKQPGRIIPVYNTVWPTFYALPSSAVLVRFTSGFAANDAFWSDAGSRIKIGMKYLISAWFNNRLPFELGTGVVDEYPYAVTALLEYGGMLRAR